MSCPELSKTKPKEIPKSILKKKSQFDQNSNSDKESYSRVKPVKSIRFSLDVTKRTNYTRTPSNASFGFKNSKKKECQGKKEKKRRRKTEVGRKFEEITRQDRSESRKPLHDSKSKEKITEISELVGRGEEDEINSKKGRRNECSINSLQKDKQNGGPESQDNLKERSFKEVPKKEGIPSQILVEDGKQNKKQQENLEAGLAENAETKRKRRQRRGRRRKKRKGKERE